ncbi:restriction endonuclease [Pengzhenrongella sicca]|uniref:Restriction endonuclease n=1 Tax=Pengzhenrongella sicca TaxID=2819238 RepID=A0A8A4ZIL3_9MICO|nr:restriction endonuclease [Pengzhenrongella sicca]QTE30357.1 restriction endonuclease [Pengzhenrongella sicca]
MLDFAELGGSGRKLEQLVRELLLQRGFDPQWSGVGPDGDRDLTFIERGSDLLGSKPRKWLVSCKDFSASGRAVGVDEANGVLEQVRHHAAQGFLLVCTTHPTASLVTRLESLERESSDGLVVHYWDDVVLERLLSTPRCWAIAQQFMPKTTDAWKIFATDSPNRWVAAHRGYYFRLSSRTAGGMRYDLESLDRRIDEIEAIASQLGVEIRLRAVWHNDTHGSGYTWYLDCISPYGDDLPNPETVLKSLGDGVAREDGQWHSFDIEHYNVSLSDHYDRDHYERYERLPAYL